MKKNLSREEIRKAWDYVAKDLRSLNGINESFEEAMDRIFIHEDISLLKEQNHRFRDALKSIARNC